MNLFDIAKVKIKKSSFLNSEKLSVSGVLGLFLTKDAPIAIKAYDGSTFGDLNSPYVINIKDKTAVSYLVRTRNELGLLRGYLTDTLSIEGIHPGDPYELLRLASNQIEFPKISANDLALIVRSLGLDSFKKAPLPALEAQPRWKRITAGVRHNHTRDANAIKHHYDVSNEFYSYVLGPSMTYTCAVYPNYDAYLEEAQDNKYRLIFEKLNLKAGDRLLDIGCGWGGMVCYAAKRGVKVIGATLSEEQAIYGQQKIIELGLSDLAEIKFSDYRDIVETGFDAISSIGLTEHIGMKNLPSYFKFLRNKLKPRGLLLNHCITRPNNTSNPKAGLIIDRYIFPDGEITGSGKITSIIQDVGGLEVLHSENLREHYALTLRDWCNNLVKNWDKAIAEAGEKVGKLWGIYMAGSRLGFESNVVQLHQILVRKLDENQAPITSLRPWWNP